MKRWTKEEQDQLLELSKIYKDRDIAIIMGRTRESVASKLSKLRKKETKEVNNVNEIKKYIKDNWDSKTIIEMSKELFLSRNTITKYAQELNLPKKTDVKWTEENLEKLKELSKMYSISELAHEFKTSNTAISTVAYANNIILKDGKVKWTEEDDETLKKLSKEKSISEIAKILNKTPSSIRLRAKRKNITLKKASRTWTKEDNIKLKELSKENYSVLQIAKIMQKSDTIIEKYLKENNLKVIWDKERPWTEKEDNMLKKFANEKYIDELIFILNRSTSSIKNRAKILNIELLSKKATWTKENLQLLKKYVEEGKSTKEIAKIMKRSESAIEIKINREHLTIKDRTKRFWLEDEDELLRKLWGNYPIEYIAEKLGRSVSSLQNRIYQLGLGGIIDNFYGGILITELSDIFDINTETIRTKWVSLGLNIQTKQITISTVYYYVTLDDLLLFLEENQNIWDSRPLEKNILGAEPDWLIKKRIDDNELPIDFYKYNKRGKILNLSLMNKGEDNGKKNMD